MAHDLRRLRLHGLIQRLPRSNTCVITCEGIRLAVFYTKLQNWLLRPLLDADPTCLGHLIGREALEGAVALDDRYAEIVLELSDRLGQRRLGDVAGGGRAGEMTLSGEGDEVLELADQHIGIVADRKGVGGASPPGAFSGVSGARHFFGSPRRVPGGVRVSARARELAPVHDQVFLTDWPPLEPAFENLPHTSGVAGLS